MLQTGTFNATYPIPELDDGINGKNVYILFSESLKGLVTWRRFITSSYKNGQIQLYIIGTNAPNGLIL